MLSKWDQFMITANGNVDVNARNKELKGLILILKDRGKKLFYDSD